MRLSTSDLEDLAALAIAAASDAGQMIAKSRPQHVQHKTDESEPRSLASQVVTEIDRRSEDIIVDVLSPTLERFGLGLLTEERPDDGGRLTADYFWCIDPLDGTLPFIEGSSGYAVSIALVANDGTPWIGVMYDPVEATLLHAIRGGGVFRNGKAWPTRPPEQQPDGDVLSVFVDRSFATLHDRAEVLAALRQVAQDLGQSGLKLHETGGAVMNACQVAAKPSACYFKFPKSTGGGSLWDFAATACLFAERGAVATDMAGNPLDLNRADSTFMGHRGVLFATDEALAQRLRSLRPDIRLPAQRRSEGDRT